MEIKDKNGGTMYEQANVLQLSAEPSNFAFVHVESKSQVNSDADNVRYIITLTLGVNTPNQSWLEFTPPAHIKF